MDCLLASYILDPMDSCKVLGTQVVMKSERSLRERSAIFSRRKPSNSAVINAAKWYPSHSMNAP
jgi:hypothetical protein